jgi:hypothetical protein
VRGVDDDDDAASVVGNAIGNVREQKLLAPAIPTFPTTIASTFSSSITTQNGLRGIGVCNDLGAAPRAGHFLRKNLETRLRAGSLSSSRDCQWRRQRPE